MISIRQRGRKQIMVITKEMGIKECVQKYPFGIVHFHVFERILPQPLTHMGAVGMDEQDAERGRRNRVDETARFDLEVFKEQEKRDARYVREDLMAVHHVIIRQVLARIFGRVGTPKDRGTAKKEAADRRRGPYLCVGKQRFRIQANVGGGEIQHGKPGDIVH